MKNKAILFAACALIIISCTGCSKKEESTAAQSSSESQSEVEKTVKDQQKTIEEQNKKIEKLTTIVGSIIGNDDPESILSDDYTFDPEFSFGSDAHDVYDDSAVIEAYKSGDSSKLSDNDKYIYDTACAAIKDIIKDDMSDYEKEKAVYDFVFEQGRFDEGNLSPIPHTSDNSDNPYGVLHDHTAICIGNATTFQLFMDMLGIECKVIHSVEQGEHAWNIVKIDGDWYHVDVTFDGGDDIPLYSKFNVTDEIKEQDSYPWDKEKYPKADSMKANYIVKTAKKIDSVYDTADVFKKTISKKKPTCFFSFPLEDNGTSDTAYKNFYNNIFNELSYQIADGYEVSFNDGIVYKGNYYGVMYVNYQSSDGEDDPGADDLDFSNIEFDSGKLYEEYHDKFGVDITIDQSILE